MEKNRISNLKSVPLEPSRRVFYSILASICVPATLIGGCSTKPIPKNVNLYDKRAKVVLPVAKTQGYDELLDAYKSFLGVPLARFSEITLPAPDGFAITVRIAAPAVVTGRTPIIVCSPDIYDDAINYDILAGGLASRGYAVLTVSSSGVQERGDAAAARRGARRAQQISYVLDNLPRVLVALGRDSQMVETNKIGVVGYSEAAWTALGMVGWGANLIPSSSIADARIAASFALMPTIITAQQRSHSRSLGRVIYGRTMIAADAESMPVLPSGSGIIGVNLPPVYTGFGGILGARQNLRRGRVQRPQREILASACASAGLFFDWCLKGEKNKMDVLMAGNGRVLDEMLPPLSIIRA